MVTLRQILWFVIIGAIAAKLSKKKDDVWDAVNMVTFLVQGGMDELVPRLFAVILGFLALTLVATLLCSRLKPSRKGAVLLGILLHKKLGRKK